MPYTMQEVMEAMEDDSTKSVIGNMAFGDRTYGFSAYKVVGNVVRVDVFRDDEDTIEPIEGRIQLLEAAQERLRKAIELIRGAVTGTGEQGAAEAYILPHLENWAEGTNQFDRTAIPFLIEALQKEVKGGVADE